MALFFSQSDESRSFANRLTGVSDPDLAMDMLVDDELPEDRRRDLLNGIENTPDGWRNLSIHFLARQVERRAVREMLEHGPAAAPATLYRIDWIRVAAIAMITAGVFGLGGLYLGRSAVGVKSVPSGASDVGNPQVAVVTPPKHQQRTIQ